MEVTVIQLLGLLASGGVLLELLRGIVKWIQGKPRREHDAWTQRDDEAKARRILEQHVHELRLVMIQKGIPLADIPKWPEYTTKDK